MLSCTQCSEPSVKSLLLKIEISFSLRPSNFFDTVFKRWRGKKRQKQIVAEGLETGYADRGRRFVRLHHPTAGIIAVLTHTFTHACTQNNDSLIQHFSEVAK